jgi:SAM-dependent methyltransferase
MSWENNSRKGVLNSAIGLARKIVPLPLKVEMWRVLNLARLKIEALIGRYKCSVCGSRVYRFEPLPPDLLIHGFNYSTDEAETCNAASYSCPRCGATDRDRLYALYIRDYFGRLPPGGTIKILDFAPTPSLSSFIVKLTERLPQSFSYRTADLFMEGVDYRVDIMDLKAFEDSSFDFFICSHVLEHVSDDRKALVELCRILKPGGQGILVVPIFLTAREIDEDPSADSAERWRRFGQGDHVRLYSKEGFLTRVRLAGFKVQQFNREHFGRDTFRRYGFTVQSVLYVVEKHD